MCSGTQHKNNIRIGSSYVNETAHTLKQIETHQMITHTILHTKNQNQEHEKFQFQRWENDSQWKSIYTYMVNPGTQLVNNITWVVFMTWVGSS